MTELALTIKWLGHACFLIATAAGTNIVLDPCPAKLGYDIGAVPAQVVFVSHSHFDHNATNLLPETARVVGPLSGKSTGRGTITIRGDIIRYKSVLTYHDSSKGRERGTNTVRVIEADGIRICHLGDLGHVLTQAQVKAIGPVDVLMIPVGGVYTIDGAAARKVVQQLKPKYAIPMHYKTPALKGVNLETADSFLKGYKHVKHAEELCVTRSSLPKETTVVVLKY